jgi:ubiquinone/menaquinone biosynthesis C-methylase UbiE
MINANNCPICGTSGGQTIIKYGIIYNLCLNCSGLYTLSKIPRELLITENDCDKARNERPINLERLRRIEEKHIPKKVLDFGCGNGQMTDLICSAKPYNCIGIDQNTALKLTDIDQNSIDTIIMTEVIEHIENPIELFRRFHEILNENGLIYIESSFVDFLGNLEKSGYVDPRIGHCSIHSRKSIEELAKITEFKVNWYSQNVVFFIK